MSQLADLGVFGLSTMGGNLARNAARNGFGVALFNRHIERTNELVADHGAEGRFVAAEERRGIRGGAGEAPRRFSSWSRRASPSTTSSTSSLPHLEAGDIIIDGGNSLFTDTNRRAKSLKDKAIRFIGMGVSGGEEGALSDQA